MDQNEKGATEQVPVTAKQDTTPKVLLWIVGIVAACFLTVLMFLLLGLVRYLVLPSPASAPTMISGELQGQLWRVERIIDLLTLMMAVGTIAVGFGALLGYSIVHDWIRNVARSVADTRAKRTARSIYYESLARFMAEESFIHWRISDNDFRFWSEAAKLTATEKPVIAEKPKLRIDLSDAIRRSEQALQQMDRISEPEDPTSFKSVRTNVLTNLGYYYAQANRRDKEDLAREYTKWAREQMHAVSHPKATSLISNDIYVRMCFGNSKAELVATREDLLKQLEIYAEDHAVADELRDYQRCLDEKIKSLTTGP